MFILHVVTAVAERQNKQKKMTHFVFPFVLLNSYCELRQDLPETLSVH